MRSIIKLGLPLVSRARCFSVLVITCLLWANGLLGASPAELLLVVNKTDQSLSVIDPNGCKQLARVALHAQTGHEVAASPDGLKAYVPIYGNAGVGAPGTDGQLVREIDLARNEITRTLDLGKGMRPHCALFGPRDRLLYLTTETDDSVTVVDPKTLKITGRVPTGQKESHMLVITRDGKRGYTSNVGPGTISVLDLEKHQLVTVIPVSSKAQRIAISPDDRWVFTADQARPQIAVIDTQTNGVSRWLPLPGIGYGMAATPDGKRLLVCLIGLSKLGEIDLSAMKVTRTLDLPRAPQEVIIPPDGKTAYVSCDRSGQVAAVDLNAWQIHQLIETGKGADGLAWAVRQE